MKRFTDRIVLITGAGSGIGAESARRLSREGAHVILHGRTESKLVAVAAELDGPHDILVGDLVDSISNRTAALEVAANHARLDVLVNNAGIAEFGPSEDLTRADLERMISTNMTGLIELTVHLLPLLRLGTTAGSIVNIASTLGLTPVAGALAYSASKAAVVSATSTLAAEWGPDVRVNCVCPGFVETPIHYGGDRPEKEVRAFLDQRAAEHPMRRIGTPEDIAAAIAYLASDEASWVTGSTLVIDGGLSVAGK